MMANAARDPYWQGSVRREVLEHPESSAAIQNECASCHMPLQNLTGQGAGHQTECSDSCRWARNTRRRQTAYRARCAIRFRRPGSARLQRITATLTVAAPGVHPRPVFGPYASDPDRVVKVHVMTTGYAPTQADQMRDAGLCGSCHTLYTTTLGPDGKEIGKLPEQMPLVKSTSLPNSLETDHSAMDVR